MMKKIILAAVLMLGVSQVFATKSYDEKYREAMAKHLEVSGTISYFEQGVELAGLLTNSLKDKEIEMVKGALPEVLLLVLEPSYKRSVSLKELKRYNRAMNRRSVRNFRNVRPEIINDVVLNIDKIGKDAEKYFMQYIMKDTVKDMMAE